MGIFGFGECKSKSKIVQQKSNETMNIDSLSYEEQLRVFESLGYKFTDGVTKGADSSGCLRNDLGRRNWKAHRK